MRDTPQNTTHERTALDGTFSICTWLYADSVDEETEHYQIPGSSSSSEFHAVYWRAVALFFATSVRHQPDMRHVLFTNVESLPTIDRTPMNSLLDSLGVEVVRLPLTYRTPPGYFHQWRNQFYVFDIVDHLAQSLSSGDSAVVLDSDCVWVSKAQPMWDALHRDGLLSYVVMYEPHWKNNGLSRVEMSEIATELLGRRIEHPLVYCGGELLALTGTEAQRLASETATVWQQLMERHGRKQPVFYEEGQTLSYLYYKLGYPVGNADPFLRRIFTDSLRHGNNNVSPHDHGLVVWHVPLEKRLGIRRLFPLVVDRESPFWRASEGSELRALLGRALGVGSPRMGKRILDLSRRTEGKLLRR